MNTKKDVLSYIDSISLIITGVFLLGFPLLYTNISFDAYLTPKQMFLFAYVIISVVLLGARTLIEGKLRLRSTPFDIPLLLFVLVMFLSSILSTNRFDALIAVVPIFFLVLAYFMIVNIVKGKDAVIFVLSTLLTGAALTALLATLQFFKIYVLPFSDTHTLSFSPFGNLIDQSIYLGLVLPIAGYFIMPFLSEIAKKRHSPFQSEPKENNLSSSGKLVGFSLAFVIITIGLVITIYQLTTSAIVPILPYITGFQIAFAAISQDTTNVLKSFLLGSGYGTFVTDFTRFRPQTYNTHPTLWTFTFFRSSSYFLELLATTGVLGVASLLFIVYRFVREKSFFLPVAASFLAILILPFSFGSLVIVFLLLALFSVLRSNEHPTRYPDVEYYFIAIKKGLFSTNLNAEGVSTTQTLSRAIPVILCIGLAGIIGFLSFYSVKYFYSDILFKKAVTAYSQNNGQQTYQLQTQAINMFPYRDVYQRFFSQTNLALANSLVSSQPAGSQPSAELQNNVVQLIQQAIQTGRNAVTISPLTALNWSNLSSIYRSLIGFGQNADQFAIISNQQAIALDPNNPDQYINLGGIYYQLQQWEQAQQQFQIAISLKRDYPNAYYNLGHTLESKGDLQNALTVYETVKSLVAKDPTNLKQISQEIDTLKQKIGQTAQGSASQTPPSSSEPSVLEVNKPENQLPERKPPVEIPGPSDSVTPTPTGTTTSPTPSQ